MTDFEKIFEKVIKHEGYYANVEGDKGGETYMGIARNIHKEWKGWLFVDDYKMVHGKLKRNEKIENVIVHDLVLDFYFEKYWKENGIQLIHDFNLKYIIFDWCVNSGIYGAIQVQRLVGAKADGIIGIKTAAKINEFNSGHLFAIIKHARINFYHKIAVGQNEQFLQGWLNRINSINYE